jgi:hypothetical protein
MAAKVARVVASAGRVCAALCTVAPEAAVVRGAVAVMLGCIAVSGAVVVHKVIVSWVKEGGTCRLGTLVGSMSRVVLRVGADALAGGFREPV